MRIKLTVSFFLAVIIYSCSQNAGKKQSKESSVTPENVQLSADEMKNKSREIVLAMQETLSGALKKAIADSGVAYALQYCNLNAYPLTDSISALYGVRVKRVSHKVRNPANQATEDQLKKILAYQKAWSDEQPLQPLLEENEHGYTYYAPILIMAPLCLKCHGQPETDIAPQDFIAINMLYPKDEATGFALNDLRGMWVVEWDKEAL